MREKEFNKLIDEVTERVTLNILGAHWVCYRCGDKSVIERVEKLEQEVAKRRRIVDAVRCKDCRYFQGDGFECARGIYCFEDDYCSMGVRREGNE